jgi:DNA-3-methyladenine glycosylase I
VAAIDNARAYLALRETTMLSDFLWGFLPDGPLTNAWRAHRDVPATTATSTAMAKALKSRGFRFVGPTTAYAFMQSVGMVCDHLASCHQHGPCAALQAAARDRLRSTSAGVREG